MRLQQDLAGFGAASGAARDLYHQLAHAFQRTKVHAEQGLIHADDADHAQAGEIVPLGQHLGADQNMDVAAGDVAQQAFQLSGATHAV